MRSHQVFLGMALLSSAAVAVAFADMPYGYYSLLRLLVCATAIVGAYNAAQILQKSWLWIFLCIAVLYNPVVPVHLGVKSAWIIVNIVTLVMFSVGYRQMRATDADAERPS